MQIEFAKYCKSHGNTTEWGRELSYELDKRLSNGKQSCSIDFWIKQKFKQYPMAIEFKQQNSPRGCIKAMLRDVEKVEMIKYSQDDLRGVWCIGVHNIAKPSEIDRLVAYHSDEIAIEIKPDLVYSKQIGKTGFSVTVSPPEILLSRSYS
jgi:hypothetical protein